jgi:hypothetical protein
MDKEGEERGVIVLILRTGGDRAVGEYSCVCVLINIRTTFLKKKNTQKPSHYLPLPLHNTWTACHFVLLCECAHACVTMTSPRALHKSSQLTYQQDNDITSFSSSLPCVPD